MNRYLDRMTVERPWIIPKAGLLQETASRPSEEVRCSFIRPLSSHLLDTLNYADYISSGSCLIYVAYNPYYQLEDDDKERFLESWIAKISMISQPIINIILNFSKLKDNWDSYGAEKINLLTIFNAINFFMRIIDLHPDAPLPFVAPVPDGRIHFEWGTLSSELRHIVPKEESACYVYKIIDKSSGELKQYSNSVCGMDQMVSIFSQWKERNY
jgi:hypothetical protein